MKKLRLLLIITIISMLVVPVAALAKDEVKIGYADLSRLFDEYYKTKEYDAVLESKNVDFEKVRNEKIEKIRESQGKVGLLTDDKKVKLEEEIETLKAELLEFDRQQKQDLAKDRNEKIREILLEIEKVVSTFAADEGYSVVFNDRVLLYGSESYNITDQVLKKLNASQK